MTTSNQPTPACLSALAATIRQRFTGYGGKTDTQVIEDAGYELAKKDPPFTGPLAPLFQDVLKTNIALGAVRRSAHGPDVDLYILAAQLRKARQDLADMRECLDELNDQNIQLRKEQEHAEKFYTPQHFKMLVDGMATVLADMEHGVQIQNWHN